MKEFYYQIKGKKNLEFYDSNYEQGTMPSNWVFPPIFVGKVSAEDRKEAHEKINQEYNKKFPLRVLTKDLESNDFLLAIQEMKEGCYEESLFKDRVCEECGQKFRRVDLYNDNNNTYKGTCYCSEECNQIAREKRKLEEVVTGWNTSSGNLPVIYKITNKKTNMCYIGQTKQSFTLRWWQHFKWGNTNCKFYQAIKESSLIDWIFEIIEIVPEGEKLSEREQFYINKFNSIEQGYNTATAKADLKEELEEIPA